MPCPFMEHFVWPSSREASLHSIRELGLLPGKLELPNGLSEHELCFKRIHFGVTVKTSFKGCTTVVSIHHYNNGEPHYLPNILIGIG